MEEHLFSIGGHFVKIIFEGSSNGMSLLPSFSNFSIPLSSIDSNSEVLFSLTVRESLKPIEERTFKKEIETGNGTTIVHQLQKGGYQFLIKNTAGEQCCMLICNKNFSVCECALNGDWTMRSFGLNDALMLAYAFAGSFFQTILFHASCIGYNGYAYPFTAESGTGKSTHTAMWMECVEGAQLINDDNPIIRIINGKPTLYGSPWSGKTPCYRNINMPIGAVVKIVRDSSNHLEHLNVVDSFVSILAGCSTMMWDETIFNHHCDTISTIIETTPIFAMHCLPNNEAALICKEGITL